MSLKWLENKFVCKDLYAPFVLEKDSEYLGDLKKKYNLVFNQARDAGADVESLKILNKFKCKILEALKCYYRADIEKCNTIIRNLIKDIGEDEFAVSLLNRSYAFPDAPNTEIQFFRSRIGNPSNAYVSKDMLHLPLRLRAKSGNYRFSIPGNPSLYLSNSSYVPYKIGKLQIQGFSEPITSKKIKQSYHITQKAARSRPRAAFLRGKLGRRQKFSKK